MRIRRQLTQSLVALSISVNLLTGGVIPGALVAEPTPLRIDHSQWLDLSSLKIPEDRDSNRAAKGILTQWAVAPEMVAPESLAYGQAKAITFSGQPARLATQHATLTAKTSINVRQGAGIKFPVITILQPGETVEILARCANAPWWLIRQPTSGLRGWVSANPTYVTVANTSGVPDIFSSTPPASFSTASSPVVIEPAVTATATPPPVSPADSPPTPTPTSPATLPNAPRILSFSVMPTSTLDFGATVSFVWQAEGDSAEICPVIASGAFKCRTVPLTGTTSIVTDEPSMSYLGYVLRVKGGAEVAASRVDVQFQCRGLRTWFFPMAPPGCPATAALFSSATTQRFEQGTMIWIEAIDTFFVIYGHDEARGEFQIFRALILTPGASSDDRVGEEPPSGLLEPIGGFGLLWRGDVEGVSGVRERLGWAVEAERMYNAAYQCAVSAQPEQWTCYLRAPNGAVVRLYPDSNAQTRFAWERVME